MQLGRDKLRVWDQQKQATIYKVNKQGPTVYHRTLYSVSCKKKKSITEKNIKENIHVDI